VGGATLAGRKETRERFAACSVPVPVPVPDRLREAAPG
jgi:hypothetical protein